MEELLAKWDEAAAKGILCGARTWAVLLDSDATSVTGWYCCGRSAPLDAGARQDPRRSRLVEPTGAA